MDEEASKKSEETRRISNEGEKGDYVSDRGWRSVQVLLGEPKKQNNLDANLDCSVFIFNFYLCIFD